MFRLPRAIILTAMLAGATPALWAAPAIPEPLAPWVPWVLHDDEQQTCPFWYNAVHRQCLWPGRLVLNLTAQGGEFTQHWQVYGEHRVPLPGDSRHWPLEVQAGKQAAVVTEQDGRPGVWLANGEHVLSGKLHWQALPEFLQVPAATALIELRVDGVAREIPELDNAGRLWLHGRHRESEAAAENRLALRVFRRVTDEIPLQLETLLELDVAGKPREVVLGPVTADEAWLPMRLESGLPARLEPDGRLRIQVRPGFWTVSLTARYPDALHQLRRPLAEAPWPDEEVWVFEARNPLRLIDVQEVIALDPQQTGLPEAWRQFPAYRMQRSDIMHLVERRRGDPEAAPPRLHLERHMWLDFDGHGYTLQDRISGSLPGGGRLEMAPPARLGRVSIDGEDQFITRLPGDDAKLVNGVEIRSDTLDLEADSRINHPLSTLPAGGWLADLQQLSTTFHLPPGWRLLHATGVDRANDTWLNRWNLLNLFVVLITALAIGKLWHWGWGLLSLATLVLIYHEPGAPRWVFLHIVAAVALLRVLPADRWFTWLALRYRDASLLALVLISVGFMVDQARQSLYPQLEYPWRSAVSQTTSAAFNFATDDTVMAEAPQPMQQMASSSPKLKYARAKDQKYLAKKLKQIDPNARIQTGPGLPQWNWNQVYLGWSGPVRQDQTLRLYLVPPVINSLFNIVRIGLLALLGGFLLYTGWRHVKRPVLPAGTAQAAALVVGGMLLLPVLVQAGDENPPASQQSTANNLPAVSNQVDPHSAWPSAALLKELHQRLTAPPDCLPHCAANPRLHLEADADTLQILMEVHTQAEVAIPLPGTAKQWLPAQVWVNGEAMQTLRRYPHGELQVVLPAGIHHLQLRGPLPARTQVQLPLPLPAHHVTAQTPGWRVEGIHANGVADKQLQFSRETSAALELEMGTLPGFVEVERTLILGLEWRVDTVVRRLTPADSAVVAEIPLLPGESVTSERPRSENGRVLLNMAPGSREVTWTSVLDKQDTLTLTAPHTTAWREVWKLEAGTVWHVTTSGIPVIQRQPPLWRPWPGETVTVAVSRPAGVSGQVMTIDRARLEVAPGKRDTRGTLHLTLRSSRGGRHAITLPPKATLHSVSIDERVQPIPLENGVVDLPLTPGTQNVTIVFNEARGMSRRFITPAVDLGSPGVNLSIEVQPPADRWLLFTHGPALGPAVLFWGVLLIVFIGALALHVSRLTPLNGWQWLLLGLVVSQVYLPLALLIVAWFVALQWRAKLNVAEMPDGRFNLLQLLLVGLTFAALAVLVAAIEQGLLGRPQMQITGNGSSPYLLHWYQDRIDSRLPQARIFSLSLPVYRFAMLAWALWLAFALLRWLRWGWGCFSAGGVWRVWKRRVKASAEGGRE